jgi:predicted phage terminase large subunit-like protein
MLKLSENTDLAELPIIKHKADRSMLFFTRYFFAKKFKRKFVIGEHHQIISDALDKVLNGEITKLIINIAPRYGKTELAVKNFIAKGLAQNAASRFIHLSYSDDLALDNSDEVRELVKHEDYQLLYPHVQIKPNSDSKKKWYTTENGGVYATSAAGQVTGFGAGQVDSEENEFDFITESKSKFGGALIIDDPIKPEDGDSETKRERINQRYDSTIKNRVNSRNTPIIIIMQRVHENDLCGFLIDKDPGEWTVLSLPCIKPDGAALWPFKHTLDELAKLKKDNELVFERQYQQDPKPLKGMLFPAKELQYFKPDALLKFESSLAYADIADAGEDSTSVPVGRNIKDLIYVTDWVHDESISDVTIPKVKAMLTAQSSMYIRVESNNMGAMYGRNLQKEIKTCTVYPAVSTSNKHTRIMMEAAFIMKYCRFLSPEFQSDEYKKAMKELTSYLKNGKSKHDDAPDALSGLAMFIRGVLPHLYR